MATFQISDIQANTDGLQNWNSYMMRESTKTNVFLQSGIAVNDATMDAACSAQEGSIVNVPTIGDIPDTAPTAGSDAATEIVPEKIGTGNEKGVICHFNKALEVANISNSWMQGEDPLMHIANRFAAYWGRYDSVQAASVARGVYEHELVTNIPGSAQSLILDASAGTINLNAVLDAQQLRGDKKMDFVGMLTHSKVHTDMQKLGGLVDNYDPETGQLMFQSFDGKRVIYGDYDDELVDGAGNYITILFIGGAMAMGNGTPVKPLEYDSKPLAGHGSGLEAIINRRKNLIHPYGYRYTGATQAKNTGPEYAELLLPANWERSQLAEKKNIGAFYLLTS